jgi:hypothetical protein
MRYVLMIFVAVSAVSISFAKDAAIVEDASVSLTVGLFDVLKEGDEVDLGELGTVTLGYFSSCVSETITGGRVIVGSEQSEVFDGDVARTTVECDGGNVILSESQQAQSGADVFRDETQKQKNAKYVSFSDQPILIFSEPIRSLRIRRVDDDGIDKIIDINGAVANFEVLGVQLSVGGIYQVRIRDRRFYLMPQERSNNRTPSLLNRMIRYQ